MNMQMRHHQHYNKTIPRITKDDMKDQVIQDGSCETL